MATLRRGEYRRFMQIPFDRAERAGGAVANWTRELVRSQGLANTSTIVQVARSTRTMGSRLRAM